MRENKALAAWRAGGQTIGAWLSVGNAYTAETMTGLGFDWLCVDLQHGMLSYDDLKYMLPAISTKETVPLVRVPWNEPYEIMKALDAGAYGVIVPMVNNREEAEQAVSACRYPPDGGRSFGPIRAGMYAGRGYAGEANSQIACIAMIETEEAIGKLDEIMSTPGLDAVYIGPSDLGYALGLGPAAFEDPKHIETVNLIFSKAKEHGIAAGIHTGSLSYTQKYLEQGFNFVTLGTDSAFMGRLAGQELAAARKTAEEEKESTGYN
ncbi:MAG: aldolase/citrate lyase family protein [Pseudomonadales bacterium]|jgi:4-hydroxy-2-oxoheptanedioate aldolase|nr:aldolase/citrate lyase family protein [Pseudomonadales bacterium]